MNATERLMFALGRAIFEKEMALEELADLRLKVSSLEDRLVGALNAIDEAGATPETSE